MHRFKPMAAAMALLSAQSAWAQLSLYGDLRIGLASIDFESRGGRMLLVDTASAYIGLRGVEALDEGRQLFFDLQQYVCLDGGQKVATDCAAPRDGFANRAGWLGLRGQWGELRLGRGHTPYEELTDRYDPSTGLGTGVAVRNETVLPRYARLEPAHAAPLVAAFGAAVAAQYGQPAAEQAMAGVNAALQATASGVRTATMLPALARMLEAPIQFDNAVRYDWGQLEQGWHGAAMLGLDENQTEGQAQTRRFSGNLGYHNGLQRPGQLRIDLAYDYTRHRHIAANSLRGQIAAGLQATEQQLEAGLLASGMPAPLAAGIRRALFTPTVYYPYVAAARSRTDNLMLATSYVLPFGRINLMAGHYRYLPEGEATARRRSWSASWEAGTSQWGAFIGYRDTGSLKVAGVNQHDGDHKLAIGYERYLSRRTKLISEAFALRLEDRIKPSRGYVLGVSHRF